MSQYRSVRLLSTLFALSLALPLQSANAAERAKVDSTKPMIAGLSFCSSKEQLDCIESIDVLTSDSKRLSASQLSISSDVETDELNQTAESGSSVWSYKTTSGAINTFTVNATLTTPEYVVSGSQDEVDLSESNGDEESVSTTPPATVSLDTRYFEPKLEISLLFADPALTTPSTRLASNESVEISVRTSWLVIEDVYISGKNASIKTTAIKDGNRITLAASEIVLFQLQKLKSQLTGQVREYLTPIPTISFTLSHPRKSDSAVACSTFGYRLMSTNGSSLSLADENEINSLLFKASGLPKKEDGSANLGYIYVSIPIEWARCIYPSSDFSFGEKFNVEVTSNSGAPLVQNVSSSAVVKGDKIEIKVEGFEFAKTEILISTDAAAAANRRIQVADAKAKAAEEARLKAEAEAKAKAEAEAKAKAEAEAKAKAKKTSITCVKGKQTKKVTAVNPKCPSGYKKK